MTILLFLIVTYFQDQGMDSLSLFTSGLDSMPSHEEKAEEFLPTSEERQQENSQLMDLLTESQGYDQREEEDFLPKEELLPSVSDSPEEEELDSISGL